MNENNRNCSILRKWDLCVFLVGIIVLSIILFQKCKYGFGNIDESFYLTIPYRLSQGDGLFINEWHLSQMCGILLLPFVSIYTKFNSGTEGIILAFRYFYVAIQLFATTLIYSQLRKWSSIGSLVSALLWVIYAPFGIMALSYNSMGIICLTMSLVLITCSEKNTSSVIGGILFASAVLCCPYLAIIYGIYVIVTLVFCFRSTRHKSRIFSAKRLINISIGIATSATAFLIFVFSRMHIKDFFDVMPLILDDPEHKSNIVIKAYSYIISIIGGNILMPMICGLYALVFLIGTLSKNKGVKYTCLISTVIITGLHLISYIVLNRYINHLMFPINVCAFICYWICKNDRLSDLFYGIWVPGIIYTVCLHLSSNQSIYAITSAASVPMVCSVIIVIETIKDNVSAVRSKCGKSLLLLSLICIFLLQFGGELYFRWYSVFWEKSINEQTQLLSSGPEAGLLVSTEKQNMYEAYLHEVDCLSEGGEVLFLSPNTWLYLCGNWNNASYSAWLSGVNDLSVKKLHDYYRINPNKLPDQIFVDNSYSQYVKSFSDIADYSERITDNGNYILARK